MTYTFCLYCEMLVRANKCFWSAAGGGCQPSPLFYTALTDQIYPGFPSHPPPPVIFFQHCRSLPLLYLHPRLIFYPPSSAFVYDLSDVLYVISIFLCWPFFHPVACPLLSPAPHHVSISVYFTVAHLLCLILATGKTAPVQFQ